MNNMKLLTQEEALRLFAKAWNTLDPSELILHLAEDIRYSSQTVIESMTTVDEVSEYLKGKMEILQNAPENRVFAELGETQPYPMYPKPPRPCVLMAQSHPDNIRAVVLIEVSDNKISSIDWCVTAPVPSTIKRSGEYPK